VTLQTDDLQVGAVAPTFMLAANAGQVSLADYRGRQHVLLFFMRTFTCPACMQHARRLAHLHDQLRLRWVVLRSGTLCPRS
jgi:peroxiredoxin